MQPYTDVPINARNSSIGLINALRSLSRGTAEWVAAEWVTAGWVTAVVLLLMIPLRARVLSRISIGTAKTANSDNGVKDISKSTIIPFSSEVSNVVVDVEVDVDAMDDFGTSRILNSIPSNPRHAIR
jgi:hypothetical protein